MFLKLYAKVLCVKSRSVSASLDLLLLLLECSYKDSCPSWQITPWSPRTIKDASRVNPLNSSLVPSVSVLHGPPLGQVKRKHVTLFKREILKETHQHNL